MAQYCKKDGNYIASIDIESAKNKKAKNNAALLAMNPKEAVDQGEITLLQLPQLIKAQGAYRLLEEAKDQEDTRGIWIWGPPGVGKSHKVRTMEPSLYLKAQNKWWDGYAGQEAVLLDDLDKGGQCLGHYMKIWTDKWAATGECKGSTIPLNYKRFYVTSNYCPAELWGEDRVLKDAIERRFKIEYQDSR